MGLDMYLLIKRKHGMQGNSGVRGACGGLFNVAPVTEEAHEEFAYWRKRYKLDRLICEIQNRTDDDNAKELPLTDINILDIIHGIDDLEYYDEDDREADKEIFLDALSAYYKNGDEIFYMNWY